MKKIFFSLIAIALLSSFSYGQTSKKHLVILGWDEWGRHSKDCDGWGLCNAQWFYYEEDRHTSFNFPLQYNPETGEYFVNIFVNEDIITKYSNENLDTIIVDEDIILSTKAAVGRDLIIKNGEYSFDESLNGYYVPLK